MAPPNPQWVQRYMRDHNLNALLGDAVNQAVEQRSTDPAAALAQYFTSLSKRNGEVTKISARMCYNSEFMPAVELSVECFFNGGTRIACITMGEPITIEKPVPEEGEEKEEEEPMEGTPEEMRLKRVQRTVEHVNELVGPAMVGLQAKDIVACDEVLKCVPSAPTILTSLALAEAGACMKDEPLYAFVAKAVEHLKSKFETALGGGHQVEVPSAHQLLNDEETPLPAEQQAEPSGGIEVEQSERPFEPQGLPVKMPVVMVPAIACGPSVNANSKVRMHAFWLMSKRDQSLSEAIPNIIKAYNSLKVAMEARAREARKAAQEAALAEEEGCAGEARGEGQAVVNQDGFFLMADAESVSEILGYIEEAVRAAGLVYGSDIKVCCNMGASQYFVANSSEVGTYCYKPQGIGEEAEAVDADNWADWVCSFLDTNPAIEAIEDVAANEDYETWRKITLAVGARKSASAVTILGATLYNDDPDLYRAGVAEGWATGAVMCTEKLGTLSEFVNNVLLLTGQRAQRVVSQEIKATRARIVMANNRAGARAEEAEADLAVAVGAWGIKSGAPMSSATIAKLNRLIFIQEHLAATHAAAEAVWPDVSEAMRLQPAYCMTWEEYDAQDREEFAAAAAAAELSVTE